MILIPPLMGRWEEQPAILHPDRRQAAAPDAAGVEAHGPLAHAQPQAPRAFVREHSQELDDEVCDRHIGLYVLGDVNCCCLNETFLETMMCHKDLYLANKSLVSSH